MQRSETNCPLGQGLLAGSRQFCRRAGGGGGAVGAQPAADAGNGRGKRPRSRPAAPKRLILARRIVSVLEPFVGEGKVRAEVRLEIDYDTVSSGEEIF